MAATTWLVEHQRDTAAWVISSRHVARKDAETVFAGPWPTGVVKVRVVRDNGRKRVIEKSRDLP